MQLCAIGSQQYQKSQVNFTSDIRFVNRQTFEEARKSCVEVLEPWTFKEIIRATRAATSNILDCIAGGVLVRSKENPKAYEVVMFHINSVYDENKNPAALKKILEEKLDGRKPVRALIIGGKDYRDYSMQMFDMIEGVIKGFDIPYTKMRGDTKGRLCRIAYDGVQDEWLVSSSALDFDFFERNITPLISDIKGLFGQVKMASDNKDHILIDTYA